MIHILGLLGMNFDAVVVEVKTFLLLFRLALAILCIAILGVRSPRERIICKVENALGLEFHHPSILRNTTPGQLNYCVQRTSQKIARLESKDHIKSKIRRVQQINP